MADPSNITEPRLGDPSQGESLDDFVAPQDLIGEELAAQLQQVLDEAGSHLTDAPAAPAFVPTTPTVDHAESHPEPESEEDGFESPAQVLAMNTFVAPLAPTAPAAEIAAASPADPAGASEDENEAFEQQLRELMALASDKKSPSAAKTNDAPIAPAPAEPTGEINATAAKAQSVQEELDQLSRMIGESTAGAAPSAAAQASPDAKEELRTESVTQLDEILAGHADDAVADEFETVNDVIALEKALAELKTSEAPIATPNLAAPQQTVAPTDPSVRYGDDTHLAAAPSPVPPTPAPAAAVNAAPAVPESRAAAAPTPAPKAAPPATKAALRDKLLRLCVRLNSPLRNLSPATRNLVGYAGLITFGNGILLMLLKLMRG